MNLYFAAAMVLIGIVAVAIWRTRSAGTGVARPSDDIDSPASEKSRDWLESDLHSESHTPASSEASRPDSEASGTASTGSEE